MGDGIGRSYRVCRVDPQVADRGQFGLDGRYHAGTDVARAALDAWSAASSCMLSCSGVHHMAHRAELGGLGVIQQRNRADEEEEEDSNNAHRLLSTQGQRLRRRGFQRASPRSALSTGVSSMRCRRASRWWHRSHLRQLGLKTRT